LLGDLIIYMVLELEKGWGGWVLGGLGIIGVKWGGGEGGKMKRIWFAYGN
jgi:hypothetical protein